MNAGMKIELLGTMRVLLDGKPLPKVRSRKAKWLLALLALRGGKPIGRSFVARMLWPDADPAIALTNLRSVLSDLRHALGDHGSRLLTPDRRSLAFDFEGVEIDVLAFDAAIENRDLEMAVSLYAGSLLQDCDEEWVGPERNTREGACLVAYHELAQRVEAERAILLCQKAIEVAPWQDVPRRDLMAAYVQTGNVNAALSAYREFADAIRSETGGVPDPRTTELYVRLRAGVHTSGQSEPTIRGSLPHAITSFVGREDERIEVIQAIRSHRLVTLTGTGGIGKTRLAREVALDARIEFPDGAGFVALEAVPNESSLVQAVVSALQIKLAREGPPSRTLLDVLKSKRLLLVLDNCEHLLSGCADLANRILAECPSIRILATSREPMDIVGERVWSVPGLTTPDPKHLPEQPATLLRMLLSYESVRLFVERAQTATRDFALTYDNAFAVAELCAMLDGFPLSLELAAGRVRTMSVPDVLERFRSHRLDFFAGNRHVTPARHQTLRATIDWSYSLLGAEERELFARLAIFSDGWTLKDAEAVAGATPSLIESLVEKSLLVFSTDGRYGFLETIRQYAAERLVDTGDLPYLRRRHADHYTELAERLAAARAPNEAFDREIGNLNAVMDRAETDPLRLLEMTRSLVWYWQETYAVAEGARRTEDALKRSSTEPSRMRAQALRNLALMRSYVDRTQSVALHKESLRMWRELGDLSGEARTLDTLGLDAAFTGDTKVAQDFSEESISIARKAQAPSILAYSLQSMAQLCIQLGDYARAKALAEESLDLMKKSARPMDVAAVLRTLGLLAHDLNDFDTGRRWLEEGLAVYRSNGNHFMTAWCLADLGNAATELGQTVWGQDLLEEALAIMRKLGDRFGIASSLESLGGNAVARGDVEVGRRLLSESLAEYRALRHRFGVARALDGLGDAARQIGEMEEAGAYYREGLAIWRVVGAKRRVRDDLLRIGDGMEDLDRSVRIWAFAHRLGEEIGAPIPRRIADRHSKVVEVVRSDSRFEALWAAGRELSFDAAIDLAIQP